MPSNTREQLHQQIDSLPDHLIDQIVKFTQLLAARQEILKYSD